MRLALRTEGSSVMRVLVVEDNRELCDLLRDFLLDLGHEPLIAHGAESAFDLLRSEPLDVILLDIRLPGMSGLDFLRLQAARDLSVPIVVMSGAVTEAEARECLRLGAFDFLGKPFAFQRLEEILACFSPPGVPRPAAAPPSAPRRRASRASVALPVKVREYNGLEWDATAVDLSASGIKVRPNGAVHPGPAARLSIALPDGTTRLEVASVLLRADLDGYAFYFLSLGDGPLRRVSELVQRLAAGQSGHMEPHLSILHRIGQAVGTSLDVDEVLRIALDALTQVTGHEISSLHLLSPDGTALHLRGDRGLRPHLRDINRVLPVGQGVIGRVAASGQTIHLADASGSSDLLPAARAAVKQEGIHAFVCVPIRSRGRILGALSLGRRTPEPFTEAEIALVEASASQIGPALENAQLASETRRQLEDLKAAETELMEREKLSAVGQLTAGLVHEIRNLLTPVLAHAQLALAASDDPAKTHDRLHMIVQHAARAARMLQSLLQFSRPQATERRPCRLETSIRGVLELKGPELQGHGIQVVTQLEPVPPVWADDGQIQQVLLNLIQNAQEAMATRTGERVLTVRLVGGEGRVRIEVLDTGPGIPRDALPRVFNAFTTTKPAGEGTGLGLWISHALIERHDGSLRAENRPEGGAAFTIELPYRQEARPNLA